MISCALAFADMIVFGLAERAPLKKVRKKLMVGESGAERCGNGVECREWSGIVQMRLRT